MVERSAPIAGEDAEQTTVVVDHRCQRTAFAVEFVERCLGRDVGRQGVELAAHDVLELGEAVETGGVVLGEHPDRSTVAVDHDHCAVGPLVDQVERVADRVAGRRA